MLRTLLEPFSNPVWPILSIGSVLFLLQYKFVCSTTQKSTRRRVSSNISNLRQNRKYPNTLGIFLLNYALVRTNQLPWPHLTTEKRFYLSIVTIQPVFLPTLYGSVANRKHGKLLLQIYCSYTSSTENCILVLAIFMWCFMIENG